MPRGWGFSKIWRFIFPRFLSPGIRVFENLGIFIPEIGYFLKFWDINARGSGIFIPEIWDFRNLGIFIPGDWGFLSQGVEIFVHGNCGFFGDFLSPRSFGDRDVFRWMRYPTKKPPLVTDEIKFIYLIFNDFSKYNFTKHQSLLIAIYFNVYY